ncbi:F0F1 ATP synthase subunit A [Magnetococcales bacterium HHB-1]
MIFASTAHAADTAEAAANAAPKMDPLHHFVMSAKLKLELFGVDISIYDSVIWMWIAIAVAFFMCHQGLRGRKKIPGRLQSLVEILIIFVRDTVEQNVGKEGRPFFPFVLTLFLFVLFCNVIGLIPGSYTATSQLIVTGTLAMGVFILSTALGFYRHGVKFLGFFVPAGLPPILLILMVPIEIISYLVRPVSLSVRLFANMTAGHTVLGVLFFFTVTLPVLGAWLPFGLSVVFNGFELFIGFVQAYIFTILTCVYLNDSIHMH